MRQFAIMMADEADDDDLDVMEKHLRDAAKPTGPAGPAASLAIRHAAVPSSRARAWAICFRAHRRDVLPKLLARARSDNGFPALTLAR